MAGAGRRTGDDEGHRRDALTARTGRRRTSTAARALVALLAPLVGRPFVLPAAMLARYPELAGVRWRRGGLPLRVGGWCLGRATVSGITLWRTVFLAESAALAPALLLHELAHARQFARGRTFPLRYCWESLRRGYARNRFEVEADAFAATVLAVRPPVGPAPTVRAVARGIAASTADGDPLPRDPDRPT